MKSKLLPVLCAPFAALLLCQCTTTEESSYPSSSSPNNNVSGNAQNTQNVYNEGYQLGMSDGQSGRSRTPSRYDGAYPAGESDAFTMGYEKGYNQGIR